MSRHGSDHEGLIAFGLLVVVFVVWSIVFNYIYPKPQGECPPEWQCNGKAGN